MYINNPVYYKPANLSSQCKVEKIDLRFFLVLDGDLLPQIANINSISAYEKNYFGVSVNKMMTILAFLKNDYSVFDQLFHSIRL